MDVQYASNGKANAALATGIIGTAGFGLNLLGNLFGGLNGCNGWGGNGCAAVPVCSENMPVNRFELGKEQEISRLQSENDRLRSDQRTDGKILDLYRYIEQRFTATGRELAEIAAAQAVTNQKLADDMKLVTSDFSAKLEAERAARCCADTNIVNYANQTFYAKLIAGVTPTNTTTPQETYNPVPKCGGCECSR